MIRRLVKLDPANGERFSEVDPIVVRRTAKNLKDYIERCIDQDDDEFGIHRHIYPFWIGALDGSLKLPMIHIDLPFKNPMLGDLLPESFQEYWAQFAVPATASHLEKPDDVYIDAVRYT